MALLHTSDDALAVILSFLKGEDVMRLMATGSKRLIARVAHNTTELVWRFSRPAYFPSCSFDFPNLRSLSIKTTDRNGHLSLSGRSLLPSEPMASLETLEVRFPTSPHLFAPATSFRVTSLASSFPRLTSLAVQSKNIYSLPLNWTESLPQSLLSLTVDICTSRGGTAFIDPSSFESLPVGLQHMEFGRTCFIGAGKINLLRFADLRVLRLLAAMSWDVLESLPNTLEELSIQFLNGEVPETRFALSKLPPQIKVLMLSGAMLELDFDSMAPSTLESLNLDLNYDLQTQDYEKFFHTKNLRVVQGIIFEKPESLALHPNAKELLGISRVLGTLDTFEKLPKKLESLALRDLVRDSPSLSFKYLPPDLKGLTCSIIRPEDISELPKSLTSARLRPSAKNPTLSIPAAVWKDLSPCLRNLDLEMNLFQSEDCFHALPESLRNLTMDIFGSADKLERASFPKSLQESLEELYLYTRDAQETLTVDVWLPKLSEFSRLSSLHLSYIISINSSTLAYLPKTLLKLRLDEIEVVNFGLPDGQSPETSDWKDGAFSRLPEGLEYLNLSYLSALPGSIDFKIFSRLPRRLVQLKLFSDCDLCKDPKAFIKSLPRRLALLNYSYSDPMERYDPYEGIESPTEENIEAMRDAIADYFDSDFFWDRQRYDSFWDGQRYDF